MSVIHKFDNFIANVSALQTLYLYSDATSY